MASTETMLHDIEQMYKMVSQYHEPRQKYLVIMNQEMRDKLPDEVEWVCGGSCKIYADVDNAFATDDKIYCVPYKDGYGIDFYKIKA